MIKKSIPFILVFSLNLLYSLAQNSVSIGTEEINNNAVLQLVSPENNQGFLVPKLTTAQREAMNLSSSDNGMLVYDTDVSSLYYWHNAWNRIKSGEEINISGSGATTVSGQFPNFIIHSNPNDTSQTNELQNLSNSIAGNDVTVNISDGTGTTFSINDADADTTNEIQDLQLNSNMLSITNNTSATNIDISGYLDNTDDQIIDFDAGTNTLSLEDGGNVDLSPLIDDIDADTTNEIQNLSTNITGSDVTLNISNGTGTTFSINDADADTTNEIQDLSNSIVGSDVTVNISSGTGTTFSINDADADPGNELITDAILNGTDLELTDAGGTTIVDLSSLSGSSNNWELTGNAGTNPSIHYIGTSDANELSIRTNGIQRMLFDATNGYVGVGLSGPDERLDINGNAEVTGEYTYATLRNRYIAYLGGDLIVNNSKSCNYSSNVARDFSRGTIPIKLPNGSRIRRVEISVYDTDGGAIDRNITVRFTSKHWNNTSSWSTVHYSATTTGDPGSVIFTYNCNIYVLSHRAYQLNIDCSASNNSLGFHGALIYYTVDRAD